MPVCVDLDGTLVRTDMLIESVVRVVAFRPLLVFVLPFWLLRGLASFKARVARIAQLDVAAMPWDERLLAWIKQQRSGGRRIVLATGCDAALADEVARHLQLFDEVLASDGKTNLVGRRKRALLLERFGANGFDYVGNSRADLSVWRASRMPILVNAPRTVARSAVAASAGLVLPSPYSWVGALICSLRVRQWSKNLLVFVPLIAAHEVLDAGVLASALLAAAAFSLCASAGYLINDLLDLRSDRLHPVKRVRPLACGALPLAHGLALIPALVLAAGMLCLFLPAVVGLLLLGYLLASVWYSVSLKQRLLVDVIALACFYTVRIFIGSEATAIPCSPWLLCFSVFLFFSLALNKRVSELRRLSRSETVAAPGRCYWVSDLEQLNLFGVCSGFLAALVLALYFNSDQVARLYRNPAVLWLLLPLMLYWLTRIWMLTHRGEVADDPLVFVLRDRVTLLTAGAGAAILLAATVPFV